MLPISQRPKICFKSKKGLEQLLRATFVNWKRHEFSTYTSSWGNLPQTQSLLSDFSWSFLHEQTFFGGRYANLTINVTFATSSSCIPIHWSTSERRNYAIFRFKSMHTLSLSISSLLKERLLNYLDDSEIVSNAMPSRNGTSKTLKEIRNVTGFWS